MEILYSRCAGIDVHKKTVVVCVRCSDGPGKAEQEVRTFGTMTRELLDLSDWLAQRYPRGHGIDRRLLEAGVARA
jgi:hypothetical protein